MLGIFASLHFGLMVGAIFILIVAILIFEILMIISAIQNEAISSNTRILWVVGMLLVHPFVAIAYYFTDHKKVR